MGVSSLGNSSVNRFPPSAGLADSIGSSGLSLLATKAFADPDAGYPQGLRLHAALNENDAGRFSLVSGITIAGTTTAVASQRLDRIQKLVDSIENRISILQNNTYTNAEYDRQRLLLKFDMEDIEREISGAEISGYNLLDGTDDSGVRLTLSTGEFSHISKTQVQNIAGVDRNYAYNSDTLTYQITDLKAAFDDFRSLELLTYPNTALSALSTDNSDFLALSRFQTVIDNTRDNLGAFKKKLSQTISDMITVSGEPGPSAVNDGFDARQIAGRLGQQLSHESFNITANPALKYFSLFS